MGVGLVFGILISVLAFRSKSVQAIDSPSQSTGSLYDITLNALSGEPMDLSQFKNKPIMIVNVASKCGFTKQYKGLEELYQAYKKDGLIVIGVPSNDFGNQEPGTADEIQSFCQLTYGVSFPMAEKVVTKGDGQHPLYAFLTQSNPKLTGNVKWNFEKFIIDTNGQVVARYGSFTKPMSSSIQKTIQQLVDTSQSEQSVN